MSKQTNVKIAKKSLKEEKKAVKDYTARKKKTSNPKLKKALAHAIPEEQHHAKLFAAALKSSRS